VCVCVLCMCVLCLSVCVRECMRTSATTSFIGVEDACTRLLHTPRRWTSDRNSPWRNCAAWGTIHSAIRKPCKASASLLTRVHGLSCFCARQFWVLCHFCILTRLDWISWAQTRTWNRLCGLAVSRLVISRFACMQRHIHTNTWAHPRAHVWMYSVDFSRGVTQGQPVPWW